MENGNKMKKEDKKLKIKRDFEDGKIRVINQTSYSIPSEYFVLGITPDLVNEVIKDIQFDNKNKAVCNKK